MASFEAWDDMVRQTVVWAGAGSGGSEFGDPMSVIVAAQEEDPELELLACMLTAWASSFGDRLVSAADVIRATSGLAPLRLAGEQGSGVALAEALKAINEHAVHSAISLGKVLRYRVDRLAGGRRLEMRTDPHTKTKLWRVVSLDQVSSATRTLRDGRAALDQHGTDAPASRMRQPKSAVAVVAVVAGGKFDADKADYKPCPALLQVHR
jgi:hypothetical protein